MVAVARNHPSVILWGILNESQSHDPECRPGYQALLERLRELDPSRPVTYATCYPFHDLCLDLVDVVSINCYPGWYHEDIASISGHIDQIVKRIEEMGQEEKPFILSEIGADAIYGWRDWNQQRWSEGYQAELLDMVIRTLFGDHEKPGFSSRFCGLSIWQYCDVRSAEMVSKILGRPRGFNNKGIVDEYRRPKQAYALVQKWFREISGRGPG
jgi:beta-glucuronidase